jgi:diguanylate cyclase (GGDEF)-like protein
MSLHRSRSSRSNDAEQVLCLTASRLNQTRSPKVRSMHRWKCPPRASTQKMLSATLPTLDSEFSRILQQVDEILNALKSEAPQSQTPSNAQQLAVWCAIKEILLEKELHSLAFTDDLTGLHNRRGFLALTRHQLKLARRNAQGLLLFFCDVDHLKEINDSYGHREGDLALIRVGHALQQTFRESDILGRLCGDEFGVLALEASSANKETILHRLEKSLDKSNVNQPGYKLSLSVGVSRFDPKSSILLDELLVQADRAMYEQKRSGRDNRRCRAALPGGSF